jgi:hypothetical protein
MNRQGWTNPWDVTGFAWIANAPWVFLPAAVLIGSLIVWLQPQRREQLTAGARRAIASLALCMLIFVAWDFIGIGALLYVPYYASWLLPWTFIAVGAVLAPTRSRSRLNTSILLLSALAMVASLAWPSYTRLPTSGVASFALAIGLIGLAGLLRTVATQWVVIVTVFVCLQGWITASGIYGSSLEKADGFRVIDRGIAIVDRYITEAEPRFLLAPLPRLGHYAQGLTSVYLWGFTIATREFPIIPPDKARRIGTGMRIVVIAEQEGAAAPFNEVFAPYGVSGRVIGNEQLVTAQGPLYLTFLEAIEVPSGDGSQSADSQTASPTPERP